MQGSLGRKEMSQWLWECKKPKFLCLLQALVSLTATLTLFRGHLHSVLHSTAPGSARSLMGEVEQGSLCDISGWHWAPRCLAPHLEAVGGLWHKGGKKQSTGVPCNIPTAPLLPITADGNRNYFRYNSKWGSSWDWRHFTSPTQTPGSWEKEEGHTKNHQIFPVTQGPLCN